jgi:large subunit ribosomal protein L6
MKNTQSKILSIPNKNLKLSKTYLVSSNLNSKYLQIFKIAGPLGEKSLLVPNSLSLDFNASSNSLLVSEIYPAKKEFGTLFSQINKMIIGVTEGFKKQIKLVGIGYKINYIESKDHNSLVINIGFSHPVIVKIPNNIKVSKEAANLNKTDQSLLELNSTSLTDLNNFVYSIQNIRPVSKSFKGTGITILTP